MHTTHTNTPYNNESKYSEMGPVRQIPIQRTLRSVHVCVLHCAQLLQTTLHRTDLIISPYPPDNHHCSDDVYLREGDGPKASRVTWEVQIFHAKGQFRWIGAPIVKYRHFLPYAVQKRLNLSNYRFDCGLKWAEGCTSSIVFARWRQCALVEGHVAVTFE